MKLKFLWLASYPYKHCFSPNLFSFCFFSFQTKNKEKYLKIFETAKHFLTTFWMLVHMKAGQNTQLVII